MSRSLFRLCAVVLCACVVASPLFAQPPGGRPPRGPGGAGGRGGGVDVAGSVARMLTLDTNGDGQLTQDELTDTRLQPLVSRADANRDGTLTSAELTAFFSAEAAPPGTRPPAAPGGGFVIARPGEILPAGLQDRLQLTEQQRREVATLQEKVDQDLQRILTPEQRQQLEALRARGNPDGPGPRPSAH